MKHLYRISKECFISFDGGNLYLPNDQKMTLEQSAWHRLLSKIHIVSRLLRLEPRCVELLNGYVLVVAYHKQIYCVDINKATILKVLNLRQGFSVPLNFLSNAGYVYWGDYGSNAHAEPVNIYRVGESLEPEVVYTFPANTVRHIHNILFDQHLQLYWILTGDIGAHSGIYTATADWSRVEPFLVGKQLYRAVMAFTCENGLVYATDAVDKENYLIQLSYSDKTVKMLTSINGSCIYGGENKEAYFFSTTVEPKEKNGWSNMFSYELGEGIKNRNVHVIVVKKDLSAIRVIKCFKKDVWPMKLFQYGMVMFPKGQKTYADMWVYPMACKRTSKGTICITKDEISDELQKTETLH